MTPCSARWEWENRQERIWTQIGALSKLSSSQLELRYQPTRGRGQEAYPQPMLPSPPRSLPQQLKRDSGCEARISGGIGAKGFLGRVYLIAQIFDFQDGRLLTWSYSVPLQHSSVQIQSRTWLDFGCPAQIFRKSSASYLDKSHSTPRHGEDNEHN